MRPKVEMISAAGRLVFQVFELSSNENIAGSGLWPHSVLLVREDEQE